MATSDIIVAPATVMAPAALAVVRLSGNGMAPLARRLLRRLDGKPILLASGRALRGLIVSHDGEVIDDGVFIWRAQPHSYTGEDVLELIVHGGPAITNRILAVCAALGARPALPGEFTWRAIANGKMDWREAGTIAALANARTEAQRLAARARTEKGEQLLNELTASLAGAEAVLETIIELGEETTPPKLAEELDGRLSRLELLFADFAARVAAGTAAYQGWSVVLAGRVNSGKSSLFNALLGKERVLVSEQPGTTRDVVEAILSADPPVTIVDGAGDLEVQADRLATAALAMAAKARAQADLIIWCLPADEPKPELPDFPPEVAVWEVATKSDLSFKQRSSDYITSSQCGEGIKELREAVMRWAWEREKTGEGMYLLPEELEAINAAGEALRRAIDLIGEHQEELAAEELRQVRGKLHFGPDPGAPITDITELMAGFCLGK